MSQLLTVDTKFVSGLFLSFIGSYINVNFNVNGIVMVLRQNVASHNVYVTKRNCY
jgi:hypothetical protein